MATHHGNANVLAHDDGTVVLDKVYEVVTDHLPGLLRHLVPLINALENEVGWQTGDGLDSPA